MVTTAPRAFSRSPADGGPERGVTLEQQQGLSRLQLALRIGLTLGAIVFAYQYSLTTLVRGLSLDTPLAYLGLVPFIALALAAARSVSRRDELDIHDRHVDYIIGVPLLGAALAIVLIMPVHASTFFWLWRLDLLSLPLFVAGAVAIVFGIRALWRLKLAIAFLFLAWPLPYLTVLNVWLQQFTNVTVLALKAVVGVLPVAVPMSGYDGATFSVGQGSESFLVSIASACAGVNGMVGFVLVGVAFAALVRGRRLPKIGWLVGGLALIWAINLVRMLLIFLAGDVWGEAVAIDVLHPFIGLVTFNLGILGMILALPLFGLHISAGARRAAGTVRKSQPALRRLRVPVAHAVKALVVVLIGAGAAGLANNQMQQFELLAQDLGTPRLGELKAQDIQLAGWSLSQADSFPFVSRYFGADATWTRYAYQLQVSPTNPSPFRGQDPVVLDVISTSDLGAFSVYDLQACYRFHNYQVLETRQVELAGGVTAHSIVYYNRASQSHWLAVYWEWPVSSPHGQRYERVVVNMIDPSQDSINVKPESVNLVKAVRLTVSNWFGDPQSHPLPPRLVVGRDFLVGLSQQIVREAASHASNATTASAQAGSG